MNETSKEIGNSIPNIDSEKHVTGRSVYVDDIPLVEGTYHAVVLGSPVAHGRLNGIDTSKVGDSVEVITAEDIPGENQIGTIIQDEELLSSGELHFRGQPIAIIVGPSTELVEIAREKIDLDIEELEPVTDPREAFRQGMIFSAPRTFALGDTESIWSREDVVIVEGTVESGGQEHLYLETQGAYSIPQEGGRLLIYSSTQGPTAVQKGVSKILGYQMHMVEVDVKRIGGGFGGKEDQATAWACMAALASWKLRRPVKLVLDRKDDLYMTGKRHPYSSDFRIAASRDGRLLAYEVMYYQNAGAAADLSPAILERTLFHSTNAYYIPNVRATAVSCRTNLPPNTAFRGFGGPQAMFVIEAAIHRMAKELKMPVEEVQQKNLLFDGAQFPYGQVAKNSQAIPTWNRLIERGILDKVRSEVEDFNRKHKLRKSGYSLMPICFGISFTNTSMNQASALVNIYVDGSIGVSTGAVEMGQGVNTRILQIPVQIFGVDPSDVKIESTNTTRIINTSPSAASSTADLNGKATEIACRRLLKRILDFAARKLDARGELSLVGKRIYLDGVETEMTWKELIMGMYLERISLAEHAFYSTPDIFFDRETEKGNPFAYHVYGVALTKVTVDCLRGTYVIDSVHIVHDYGESMNRILDLGQTEGGLVQGIGWMTSEELVYSEKGVLLSNALSTYKVPDANAVPEEIDVEFHQRENPVGIMGSKAIGEPPFMYGIGTYFALLDAAMAYRLSMAPSYNSPMTPEKLFMLLYDD